VTFQDFLLSYGWISSNPDEQYS